MQVNVQLQRLSETLRFFRQQLSLKAYRPKVSKIKLKGGNIQTILNSRYNCSAYHPPPQFTPLDSIFYVKLLIVLLRGAIHLWRQLA